MSSPVTRTIKIVLFALAAVLFIAFAIDNRAVVTISFFPLPYAPEMALFLFAVICCLLGILLGGCCGLFAYRKTRRLLKAERSHVAALQNEVTALRTEQATTLPELPSAG